MTKTFNEEIHDWIEVIKALDIDGCITGSCLLDADFDTWTIKPDIDVFVFNDRELIKTVYTLQYKFGFELGSKSDELTRKQEQKKMEWVLQGKKNKKGFTGSTTLQTIKLNKNGIIVNVSCKWGQHNVANVISDFDMTIIMKGYDIKSGVYLDLTNQWSDSNTGIPNPMRRVDTDVLNTAYWIRQFDRVVKYSDRGYNTTPMAKFYIQQINSVLEAGNLWTSEASQAFYDKFAEEFIEARETISAWLADKED